MENTWSQISLNLAQHIDGAQFKVWISPLKGSFRDGELYLVARNEFVSKFIRTHFLDLIGKAATEVLGALPKIILNIAPVETQTKPEQNKTNKSTAVQIKADEINIAVGEARELHSSPPAMVRPLAGAGQLEQRHLPLNWEHDAAAASASTHQLIRSWRHGFDDFIVGPCNELAHAAARSVCENHSSFGSVLFLCSSAGLGKTHLMHSVGSSLVRNSNFRAPRIEYLTAEEFASQMRWALRGGEIDRFKARFRESDVLLLEDVHFLQDKEKTQNEVLATVTALLNRGSKVIFSSSFAPRDLRKMDEQLLSRLSSGMIGCISRPDRETRRRIITSKASTHQVSLSADVADYLADTMDVDVRQIESCIQNLALKARFFNRAITLDMARETVCNYMDSIAVVNLPEIVRMVCQGFGLAEEALNSKSRKQEYVQARNTAFYLARKHTSLSLQEIGRHFNRTHSTVIKGITSLEREISRQSPSGRQLSSTISLIEKNANIADSSS